MGRDARPGTDRPGVLAVRHLRGNVPGRPMFPLIPTGFGAPPTQPDPWPRPAPRLAWPGALHIPRGLRPLARRPRGLLGRGGGGGALVPPVGRGAGRLPRALLSLVPRRPGQQLLQRARPPRRERPGRSARPDLRQPGHLDRPDASPTASCATRSPGSRACWPAKGVGPRRPGRDLHADGARGRDRRCWPAPASARSTRWCSAGSRRPSWPAGSPTRGPR